VSVYLIYQTQHSLASCWHEEIEAQELSRHSIVPPDDAHELKRSFFLGTLMISLAEAICCRPAGLIRRSGRRGTCGHAA